ncbi:hypothetical protein HDU82_001583 [Entophlyctis luteolus]|nr:hypothetical protein HDU82_001583 [Entophlyctis luteolus]
MSTADGQSPYSLDAATATCWKCRGSGYRKQRIRNADAQLSTEERRQTPKATLTSTTCPICAGNGTIAAAPVNDTTKELPARVLRKGRVRPFDPSRVWETPPGPAPTLTIHEAAVHLGDGELVQGHRYTTDDLATAAVAIKECNNGNPPKPRRHVDIGCGLGSVLLFIKWFFWDSLEMSLGIEAQPKHCDLARKSIRVNMGSPGHGAANVVSEVRNGDLREFTSPDCRLLSKEEENSFDLVTGTPPYFPVPTGVLPTVQGRGMCSFEMRGGVEAYCAAARRCIRRSADSRFVFVQTAIEVKRSEVAVYEHGNMRILRRVDFFGSERRKQPLFVVFVCAPQLEDAEPGATDNFRAYPVMRVPMPMNEPVYAALRAVLPDEIAAALSDNRVVAFALAVVASLGTFLGGIVTMILVRGMQMTGDGRSGTSGVLVGVLQSFSAGVMLYMTFMDLVPEASEEIGARETMLYFFVGVVVFGILEAVFLDDDEHDHSAHDAAKEKKSRSRSRSRSPSKGVEGKKVHSKSSDGTVDINSEHGKRQLLRTSLITFWALLLHNMPEGLGVYLSALTDVRLGLHLTIAICLHNIPEGMAVAIPLYAAGGSNFYVLAMTLANGLAEPIGVFLGVAVFGTYLTPSVLSRCLAAVAGVMCCISIHELQPTAVRYAGQARASASLFFGMFVVFCALEGVTEFFGHPHSHGPSDVAGGHGHHHHHHHHDDHHAHQHEPDAIGAAVTGTSTAPRAIADEKKVKFVVRGNLAGSDAEKDAISHTHSHGDGGHSHSH